jgi:hypothetical protein
MKSETIEPAEDRIAREQFDAFENRERLLSEDERAARAAKLNLPIQVSKRLRQYRIGLLKRASADSARAIFKK